MIKINDSRKRIPRHWHKHYFTMKNATDQLLLSMNQKNIISSSTTTTTTSTSTTTLTSTSTSNITGTDTNTHEENNNDGDITDI